MFLSQLESVALKRLIYVDIEYDRHHIAHLPFPLSFEDESDRKFIAAANLVNLLRRYTTPQRQTVPKNGNN